MTQKRLKEMELSREMQLYILGQRKQKRNKKKALKKKAFILLLKIIGICLIEAGFLWMLLYGIDHMTTFC